MRADYEIDTTNRARPACPPRQVGRGLARLLGCWPTWRFRSWIFTFITTCLVCQVFIIWAGCVIDFCFWFPYTFLIFFCVWKSTGWAGWLMFGRGGWWRKPLDHVGTDSHHAKCLVEMVEPLGSEREDRRRRKAVGKKNVERGENQIKLRRCWNWNKSSLPMKKTLRGMVERNFFF